MSELFLGLFLTTSSGWGFSNGVGVDAKLEGKHFRLEAAATNEVKEGNEDGGTYSASITGKINITPRSQKWFATYGYTVYGYHATNWDKSASAPVVGVEYESGETNINAAYTFEDTWARPVVSLGIRSPLIVRKDKVKVFFCYEIYYSESMVAQDIGLSWRF